jgi:hypothetical protein
LIALSCGSFALAYLSWRYVENPLRKIRQPVVPRKAFVVAVLALSGFLIAIGSYGYSSEGFKSLYLARLSDRQKETYQQSQFSLAAPDRGECRFSIDDFRRDEIARFDRCFAKFGPANVIVGDSHAGNLYFALIVNSEKPFFVLLGPRRCPAVEQKPGLAPGPGCDWDRIQSFLQSNAAKVRRVIYTQAGYFLVDDDKGRRGHHDFFTRAYVPVYRVNPGAIRSIIAYLENLARDVDVIWFGPRIEPHKNFSQLAKLALECSTVKLSLDPNVQETFLRMDRYIQSVMPRHGRLRYVSQIEAVGFQADKDLYDCTAAFWGDGNHWSTAGERRFGRRIVNVLLPD